MNRRVDTRASADADLASQMAWYLQNATPELAERFLGAVQETAETLGVRRGTVKSRTARALERLRNEVAR